MSEVKEFIKTLPCMMGLHTITINETFESGEREAQCTRCGQIYLVDKKGIYHEI